MTEGVASGAREINFELIIWWTTGYPASQVNHVALVSPISGANSLYILQALYLEIWLQQNQIFWQMTLCFSSATPSLINRINRALGKTRAEDYQ